MNTIRQKQLELLNPLDKLGLFISKCASTMYFFLFCCLLLILPFVIPSIRDTVFFISSGVIQLIMLPILAFANEMQSKYTDIRSEHDLLIDAEAENNTKEILMLLQEIKDTLEKR